MKISIILDQIYLGSMALPEFQRGYVWSREQLRSLMHSSPGRGCVNPSRKGGLIDMETRDGGPGKILYAKG